MFKKNPLKKSNRRTLSDETYMRPQAGSVSRGRRIAPRTEVCRPCLVWRKTGPDESMQGVIMDLNPHGIKLRMLTELPAGCIIYFQMMRDDDFTDPLSRPIEAEIVRVQAAYTGFYDHGLKVHYDSLEQVDKGVPSWAPQRRHPRPSPAPSRMYSRESGDEEENSGGIRRGRG